MVSSLGCIMGWTLSSDGIFPRLYNGVDVGYCSADVSEFVHKSLYAACG